MTFDPQVILSSPPARTYGHHISSLVSARLAMALQAESHQAEEQPDDEQIGPQLIGKLEVR